MNSLPESISEDELARYLDAPDDTDPVDVIYERINAACGWAIARVGKEMGNHFADSVSGRIWAGLIPKEDEMVLHFLDWLRDPESREGYSRTVVAMIFDLMEREAKKLGHKVESFLPTLAAESLAAASRAR